MNKNFIKILIKHNCTQKDFEKHFLFKKNNNVIVEFDQDNPTKDQLEFLNNFKKQSKKSIVIISRVLKNKKCLFSIVPTYQEALDIIEIEDIERLIS